MKKISLFLLLYLSKILPHIQYTGIVQVTAKQDIFDIKKDFELIKDYTNNKEIKEASPPIIEKKNDPNAIGLQIYHPEKKNIYNELQYEIAKKLLEEGITGIEGIFVRYRGFIDATNGQGKVVFPRFDYGNELKVIITENIAPVFLKGNIPDHFIIPPNSSFVQYKIISSEKNEGKTIEWKALEEIFNQNTNGPIIIAQNDMVIVGNPDFLFFDSEPISMDFSTNIILPLLYVRDNSPKTLFQYQNFALQTMLYYKNLGEAQYSIEVDESKHEGFRLQ